MVLPSPHAHNVSFQNGVQKEKRKANSDGSTDNEYFTWTDEETALLLNVALSYKNENTCEGEEWESIRTRYEELQELFIERYPNNDEFKVDPAQFPNCEDTSIFSKEKINAKLKRIKFGYRKAIDSGRRSEGGRVVTILFDKCAELWSGCPAVEAMDNGIETAEEIPGDNNPDESESGLLPFAANEPARENNTGVTTSNESANDAVEKTVDARRNWTFESFHATHPTRQYC